MRVRIAQIQDMKEMNKPIVSITAYDYPTARIADRAEIPIILVGDSLGNAVLGYETTLPVTVEEMLHHVKAVVRGTEKSLVVADMPFMSYQVSVEDALRNAGRMVQEGGAHAVKLEGGKRSAGIIMRLVQMGIPVMGHLGLTPQSIHQLSGYKVQGNSVESAKELIEDAVALQDAGVFSLVLEAVPDRLAKHISQILAIPVIGIGSGPFCDGQIQVLHDLLGLTDGFIPKHAKRYANLDSVIEQALRNYSLEVSEGEFPGKEHSHPLGKGVLRNLPLKSINRQTDS
jgi:3-methyl-2-oxobutanoate hydroxymethyltransferase